MTYAFFVELGVASMTRKHTHTHTHTLDVDGHSYGAAGALSCMALKSI
jgi:hypothetical protein